MLIDYSCLASSKNAFSFDMVRSDSKNKAKSCHPVMILWRWWKCRQKYRNHLCISYIWSMYIGRKFGGKVWRTNVNQRPLTTILGSLSTRVFETRMATGREHFTCQDSGVSQIFVLIISNGERILLSNVNVVVWKEVKRKNSSLPVAVRVSKTCVLSSLLTHDRQWLHPEGTQNNSRAPATTLSSLGTIESSKRLLSRVLMARILKVNRWIWS